MSRVFLNDPRVFGLGPRIFETSEEEPDCAYLLRFRENRRGKPAFMRNDRGLSRKLDDRYLASHRLYHPMARSGGVLRWLEGHFVRCVAEGVYRGYRTVFHRRFSGRGIIDAVP